MIRFYFVFSLLLLAATSATAQFSLDGGLTLPIGEFGDDDESNAGPGFRLALNYDYAFGESVGLATKLFYGVNTFDEEEVDLDAGTWGVGGIGAGLYYQPEDALKLYGLLLLGTASTPEVTAGNTVLLTEATAAALGFELGVKYYFSNVYLTAAFTSYEPEFSFDFFGTIVNSKYSIGFLTIGAGYQFGGR
ncbi:hypothetical protein QWY85_12275 [Neolewinella lacunae]|uniref:Outer membrane protein beta-barrel domain-containing protein n=1 Tax=Neolewinella lacunae TaxID=1517758 RepID=A0A923PP66_9BACT|nr:hypothetical protein [Neolewinella lacunae]MBC6995251.1 hypothetical protein [Neolewinella lacunae]MDN3635440.1 hypothetical protein [Neolewinella lacunae]